MSTADKSKIITTMHELVDAQCNVGVVRNKLDHDKQKLDDSQCVDEKLHHMKMALAVDGNDITGINCKIQTGQQAMKTIRSDIDIVELLLEIAIARQKRSLSQYVIEHDKMKLMKLNTS